MKHRKNRNFLVSILIYIIIVSNLYITIKNYNVKNNSVSKLSASISTGDFATDKVTRNVKLYATSKVVAPGVPLNLKATSSSYNSIKISWTAATGANGYEIYRSESSNGKYSSVKTVKGTSCNNTGLTTDKTYYYKVKAYRNVGTKKVYSSYSSVVSAKPVLSVPRSVKVSSSSYNSIKTSWAAVTGANRYEIYRSTSSTGKYSKVATVTGTSHDGTVPKTNTTYYYKVRAYRDIGTSKFHSSYSMNCIVTVSNKGYVNSLGIDETLKVRSTPNLNGSIVGKLYYFQKIKILGTVVDGSGNLWDKIAYNGKDAYVSDAYIQSYSSPKDNIVNVAVNITKQFEVENSNQIAGDFDGQGLSLGYLQWCIGQGTLQPLLSRMDKQYNSEMRNIFKINYSEIHDMIYYSPAKQLEWAKGINNLMNKIIEPWYSKFVSLSKNQNFKKIEHDAEAYSVKQAMIICDKYKLRTVRGFALAFDIVVQNGSISSEAAKIIDNALIKKPNMTEKTLLRVIANAVADSSPSNSEDIRSRKIAIVNGKGIVHGSMLYLDANYGLNDSNWR